MKIVIPDSLLLKLETWCTTAWGKEVSGLGTLEIEGGDICVTGVYVLDVGSEALTDIPPERIAALYGTGVNPAQLKLWWHRHPVGDGVPGPHNWSGLDDATILNTPLGSSPDLVQWSVSIVRTPFGWVGRVDHYGKDTTVHLSVTQTMTAKEHARLRALKTWGRQPTFRKQQYKPVSKKEKKGVVASVAHFLGVRSSQAGHKDWLYRKMADLNLSQREINEMTELLGEDVLPKDVSELYRLPLYDMRSLGLITWAEMEQAMISRFDDDPQQELWAD